jgi:hypothetical protein
MSDIDEKKYGRNQRSPTLSNKKRIKDRDFSKMNRPNNGAFRRNNQTLTSRKYEAYIDE